MSEHKFLTAAEAAEELQISERTVGRLISNGTLPVVRIGRTVRINRAALVELINAATAAPIHVSTKGKK